MYQTTRIFPRPFGGAWKIPRNSQNSRAYHILNHSIRYILSNEMKVHTLSNEKIFFSTRIHFTGHFQSVFSKWPIVTKLRTRLVSRFYGIKIYLYRILLHFSNHTRQLSFPVSLYLTLQLLFSTWFTTCMRNILSCTYLSLFSLFFSGWAELICVLFM